MRFELDKTLTGEILFYMENQEGEFLIDAVKGQVIDINNNDYEEEMDFNDEQRFFPLPEWSPNDGYRLMEHFTTSLKNPIVRHELNLALNSKKSVFRHFKNAIEQYPEIEKMWFAYKEREMKDEVLSWYNALREEWGLEPIGSEPEDTSSLVLEDFVFRAGNEGDLALQKQSLEKAAALHRECVEESEDKETVAIFEMMNNGGNLPFEINSEFFIIAENASGDFAGFIAAKSDTASHLRIFALEVRPEYRGMGLGKALLAKMLKRADEQKLTVTVDLPVGADYFARALHLEGFRACVQRYVR